MQKIILIFTVCICLVCSNQSFSQWKKKDAGTNTQFTDVVMLNSETALVTGRDGSIFRTSDAGKSWINVTSVLSYIQPWNSISFFDENNGVVAGDHGGILKTTNGGINWLWATIGANETCRSSLSTGPGNIYIGTDSGKVYHSIDSGKTWTSEKLSDVSIRTLFAWRGAYVLNLPMCALTSFSVFSTSNLPSTPWTEEILPGFLALGSEAIDGEFAYGGGPGFIVGATGDFVWQPAVVRKNLSDTSWQYIQTGLSNFGAYRGVSVPSENAVYVCGTSGMVIKSTDGGDNWKSINVPSGITLNAIYFFDDYHGFAVGDSGTIYYTSSGGVTAINEGKNISETFLLEQNYPNPFNPSTTIKFTIPNAGDKYNASLTTLKIYDVLSREITTLIDEIKSPGNYEVKFDGSSLTSGIYFYRLQTGNFSLVRKMVLIK